MEESISEYYYKQLESSGNKVQTLVAFYKALFDIKVLEPDTYKIFARLYNIYGYKLIYFSLLDCVEIDNINFDGISRLISYFCKKRLGEKFTFTETINLENLAKKNLTELNKKRRLKIPDLEFDNLEEKHE